MQLLTIPTMTTPVDEACMSQGGLVDRQTAAADCVVLWTDAPPARGSFLRNPSVCPVCGTDHHVQ